MIQFPTFPGTAEILNNDNNQPLNSLELYSPPLFSCFTMGFINGINSGIAWNLVFGYKLNNPLFTYYEDSWKRKSFFYEQSILSQSILLKRNQIII